jgi:hypothetical protein
VITRTRAREGTQSPLPDLNRQVLTQLVQAVLQTGLTRRGEL